jgi:hypothetical protein
MAHKMISRFWRRRALPIAALGLSAILAGCTSAPAGGTAQSDNDAPPPSMIMMGGGGGGGGY